MGDATRARNSGGSSTSESRASGPAILARHQECETPFGVGLRPAFIWQSRHRVTPFISHMMQIKVPQSRQG
jgi:hypothetical protein